VLAFAVLASIVVGVAVMAPTSPDNAPRPTRATPGQSPQPAAPASSQTPKPAAPPPQKRPGQKVALKASNSATVYLGIGLTADHGDLTISRRELDGPDFDLTTSNASIHDAFTVPAGMKIHAALSYPATHLRCESVIELKSGFRYNLMCSGGEILVMRLE
jgi:hypothetical protein